MKITEIKELPLRYKDTVSSKTKQFKGNLNDFKAELMANWGVTKKVTDDTKILFYVLKNGKIAARWDPIMNTGILYVK